MSSPNDTPGWLKLVRHHQRRGRLALTFPFLVGALREPIGAPFGNEREGFSALHHLLMCFLDQAQEPDTVRIYTCPDLGQPVASVTTMHYYPGYARWGMSKPEWLPLDIDPPYRPQPLTDVVAAAQSLWPVVSSPIVEARFSYSRAAKAYRQFDEGDRKFIVDAFAYDEENRL